MKNVIQNSKAEKQHKPGSSEAHKSSDQVFEDYIHPYCCLLFYEQMAAELRLSDQSDYMDFPSFRPGGFGHCPADGQLPNYQSRPGQSGGESEV
jgi:hypothetical protein